MIASSDAARQVSDRPLTGKVALVTGGAGGLGSAICRELTAAGADIIVADLKAGPAVDLAASLEAAGECAAIGVALDVSDEGQVHAAVAEARSRFGGLDILINNAGIDRTVPVEELAVDEWDAILDTNLRGPFLLSRAAFREMRARGGGSIVNIVSTAAKRAWPNASAYHASKWGLLGLSHALHTEGRPLGIKVTALIAGGMRTPFLFDRFPDLDPAVLQPPENVAKAVRFVLTQPAETVVPELTVTPLQETSWP
jgi:NAD(P)-dependent dehydrogenase (short-subunit alcohol dehydrogenase family)